VHAAVHLVLDEIGWGIVGGVAAGVAAALILRAARRHGLVADHWVQVIPLAGAVLSYAIAVALGGSGFIAAFVGGLVFGALHRSLGGDITYLVDSGGQVLNAVTLIVFGAAALGPALHRLDWRIVLYAVLSLTVVRMLPVALALIGLHAQRATVAFVGWFGPRGLASIVFRGASALNPSTTEGIALALAALASITVGAIMQKRIVQEPMDVLPLQNFVGLLLSLPLGVAEWNGLRLDAPLAVSVLWLGIVISVLYESLRFFSAVPVHKFLLGLTWSPQTAMRADQVASEGAFGAVPLFAGTALISGIAMAVAVPVGLFSAIYLAEYANRRVRAVIKPVLEILAGVPTVVYGFFAALTVGPFLRGLGESLGMQVASESALSAGLVMGIMIIPFVSSLADDMITAVPQSMRDGAYALGATRSETIKDVVLRAALPGIVGGVLLAISRAIGETMIVVMAAGLSANLTANPLEAVTTVTVQIVTLLTGDQEFDSPKTLAAFALGLVLFVVTLLLNIIALHVVRKYREQYE